MTLGPRSHIFILQSGGLRDVVLLEPLVASLVVRYPACTITVACREEYTSIIPLFSHTPREVIPITFDPVLEDTPSAALGSRLNDLDGLLGHRCVELFICADRKPSWFSWYLGAKVQPQRALMASPESAPRGLLRILLADAGLPEIHFEGAAMLAGTLPETQRISLLAEAAGAEAPIPPKWRLPLGYDRHVGSVLEELGLEHGKFIACFPFDDSDSNPAEANRRSWPVEQLWSALLHFTQVSELPVLLLASDRHKEQLEALSGCIEGERVKTWLASPVDTVLQAGLIAASRAYFGSHSGLTHMAQACRIPGVSLYGGGDAWPAYAPWAAGSVGIVNPLACFDCDWDCPFSHPLCLAAIPSDVVVDALRKVIDSPPATIEILTLKETPALAPADLPAVHGLYQSARRDKREQQDLLLELAHIAPQPKRSFPLSFLRWTTKA